MAQRAVNTADRKCQLRARVQSLRDALPPEEIEARSEAIVRRVRELPGYRWSRSRLLFASFRSEVRTAALVRDTLRRGGRLVLPRVVGIEEPLALHQVLDPGADLRPGWCEIPEPIPERCPELSVFDVDFILVPGLAFDREGGRLGYGAGFFDWVLSNRQDLVSSGAAVAVAFSLQLVDEVPMQSWDVHVPMIVTEDGLIKTDRHG